MTPPHDPLRSLASLLFPADPRLRGSLVVTGSPAFDRTAIAADADVVIWGRTAERGSLVGAALGALDGARTRAAVRVRPPHQLHLVAAHRLPPRQVGLRSVRNRIRSAVRAGLLLELSRLPEGSRVLDRVADEAGLTERIRHFHFGAGGSMVVRAAVGGAPCVLRVASAGTAGDLVPVAATLDHLGRSGVRVAPGLVGHGATCGATWVLEERLPGAPPRSVDPAVLREVVEACAQLPSSAGPPTALADDLHLLGEHLPSRAEALHRVAEEVDGATTGVHGVLRHGDLWAGNLLVHRGRLTGLIDWDAAHPAGVPGADLLHLVADEERRRRGWSTGQMFTARPWRSEGFRQATRSYWSAMGVPPTQDQLDLCGVAWWAGSVAGTLRRFPERAGSEPWVEGNVDRVLALLRR